MSSSCVDVEVWLENGDEALGFLFIDPSTTLQTCREKIAEDELEGIPLLYCFVKRTANNSYVKVTPKQEAVLTVKQIPKLIVRDIDGLKTSSKTKRSVDNTEDTASEPKRRRTTRSNEDGHTYKVFKSDITGTFQEVCSHHDLPFLPGYGYYHLTKSEQISGDKHLVLQDKKTGQVRTDDVRVYLQLPTHTTQLSSTDVPSGYRLFVQSTSHNRKIHAGSYICIKTDANGSTVYSTTRTGEEEMENSTKDEPQQHNTGILIKKTNKNTHTAQTSSTVSEKTPPTVTVSRLTRSLTRNKSQHVDDEIDALDEAVKRRSGIDKRKTKTHKPESTVSVTSVTAASHNGHDKSAKVTASSTRTESRSDSKGTVAHDGKKYVTFQAPSEIVLSRLLSYEGIDSRDIGRFYAVLDTAEHISTDIHLLLEEIATKEILADGVREVLDVDGKGDVTVTPQDLPRGYRMFVECSSEKSLAQRVPAGGFIAVQFKS
eukprot:GILJ01009625.1.p1 GENE.GILJ01009625.1~~GILJ01009625.1.p1  ORF type:complete len:486 (-),score=80.64 GILJ01009625.1:127-1584(-)